MAKTPGKIGVGDSVEHEFTISRDDMATFRRLSADSSLYPDTDPRLPGSAASRT